MQAVDAADFTQHGLGQLDAVADLCRGRQVEQHTGQLPVMVLDIDATDQVGGIFLVGHPACGGRGRTFFGQDKNRRAARSWFDPCIGMDGDEQVGLHLAGFFDAHVERDKIVAITREHDPHVGLLFDLGFQALGNGQHDVFFMAATAPDRARILTAVTGVEGDGQQAHQGWNFFFTRFQAGHVRIEEFQTRIVLAAWSGFGFCFRNLRRWIELLIFRPFTFFDQLGNRIELLCRIKVKYQSVLVITDRFEREYLWRDFGFQVEHEAHHVRPVLANPNLRDVWVIRLDFGDQALHGGIEFQPLDINDQSFRILDDEMGGFQVAIVFERDTGVVVRRPDPHGNNLRSTGNAGNDHR